MDEDQKRSLGAVVRTLREARGLTRQDLVERTAADPSDRVSLEMLAKVEQGKKAPSARTLRKLAIALGMEPTDLAGRAAWWEVNELDGASAALLRLGVTQGVRLGVSQRRALGVLAGFRVSGGASGAIGGAAALGAAIGGIALSKEFADRKSLSDWFQEQARVATEGSVSEVADMTEALGLVVREVGDTGETP
ncbi:helix-turn-helix domain-containing protein [Pengzhenrongella phosphoraccumulans]|uniref:helix-turn-helix domain-containing protein n=1 Tax=Pengzhenrongella phosphoraccumulans TaxID=3114394 RepID=UPI00388EF18E